MIKIIVSAASLLIFQIKYIQGLNNRASVLARGPPSGSIDDLNRGEGNENGIRLLNRAECLSTTSRWFQKLGLVSGSQSITYLTALMEFDRFSKLMPGIKPRRMEMIAFGEFIDGNIECLAAICWHKTSCPTEMEVLNILQSPKSSRNDLGKSMTNFICEMCRENAIFPNFTSVERLAHLNKLDFQESLQRFGWDYSDIEPANGKVIYITTVGKRDRETISRMYISANKSPVLCLDGLTKDIDLGHYWFANNRFHINMLLYLYMPFFMFQMKNRYETKIKHLSCSDLLVSIFFRRKKYNEYEISFTRPTTGTQFGSGTVGGALVLSVDSNLIEKAVPVRKEMVKRVVDAIKSKINHPEIDC